MAKSLFGIETRKEVLVQSLFLEGLISHFLSWLCGVKDSKNSMSFGNTSKALSFNNKINLLIDIGALKKQDQSKFVTFMEIRNQFMHNSWASSYKECFEFLPGKANYLFKLYPQNSSLTEENQLEAAVGDLFNEVIKATMELMERIKDKAGVEAELDVRKRQVEILEESISKAQVAFDEAIDTLLKKETTIKIKNLKGIGTLMYNYIFNEAKKLLEAEKDK